MKRQRRSESGRTCDVRRRALTARATTGVAGVFACAAILASALDAPPAAANDGSGVVASEITVRSGDTLSGIATRHGVSIGDLRAWNRDKIGADDMIRAGDTLVVMGAGDDAEEPEPEVWTAYYQVRSGDTLSGIARRLGVRMGDLQRWNRLRRDAIIRVGQRLAYERQGKRPPARSLGRPTAGRLESGIHLGDGPGYRLRFPRNAYTTAPVKKTLRRCAREVKERFRGTADILYGDLSRPGGGSFPPHESHQSGRDADVGYYLAGNVQNKTMHRVLPHDIDYAKTWALLRCFLTRDRVVRVYVDRGIQESMARWLAGEGVDDATLTRLFEVRARRREDALIQHAPKHDTHLHIRFACERGAEGCSENPGDEVFRL